MNIRFVHVGYIVDHKTNLPDVPRQGEGVTLNGQRYRVANVIWVIEDDNDSSPWVRVLLEDHV